MTRDAPRHQVDPATAAPPVDDPPAPPPPRGRRAWTWAVIVIAVTGSVFSVAALLATRPAPVQRTGGPPRSTTVEPTTSARVSAPPTATATPGPDATAAPAAGPPSAAPAGESPPDTSGWAEQPGAGVWVAVAFLPATGPVDPFVDELAPDDLPIRWRQIATEVRDVSQEERLRAALDHLTGPAPESLLTAWEGRELQLASARVRGEELVLDFTALDATAPGSSAAAVMALQFDATTQQYFPEASQTCVLLDGEPTWWLHDALSCPSRQGG